MAAILSSGCLRSPQQREAAFLDSGRKHSQAGDVQRAVIDFLNAIQAMPKDWAAHYRLAQAYLSSGEVPLAINELQLVVAHDPNNIAAQLKLAEILTENKDLDVVRRGQKQAEAVLALSPDNPDALYALATAEFRLQDPEDAVRHLEQALQKVPQHLKASLALAMEKIRSNDVPGAEEVMEKAAAEAPNSAEHAVALAQLYLLLRKPDAGERQLRRALDIDPKNGPALTALAQLMFREGKKSEAEPYFRRAAALPDKAYRSLHAMFLLDTGQKDAAIAEFLALYKKDRKDREARSWLVSAYSQDGRTADAEKVLADALRQNPRDVDALLQRSELYLARQKDNEAQTDVSDVLHFQPDSAEAHLVMARIHEIRNEVASERQELSESLLLNPSLLAARIKLAHILTVSHVAKGALELLDEAPAESKASMALIVERNSALFELGDYAEMRKGVDRGLAFARIPALLMQDGILRINQKDYKGGRAALEGVLQQQPQDWRALEALALSYLAEKQPAEANSVVRQYTSRFPNSAAGQQFLGTWLSRTGDRNGARAAFRKAKSLAPESVAFDLKLAELDLQDGNLDAARNALLDLLGRQPRNLAAVLDLAQAEFRSGNTALAIAYYLKAVHQEPRNVAALNNLAYLLADTGEDPHQAVELAQQARALSPTDPTINDTIGWAYYKTGSYQSALEYLRQDTVSTPLWECHLAMAYFKTGDSQKGQAILQQLMKENPSFPQIKEVLAVMGN